MCLFIYVAQICGKDNNQYPLQLPLTTFVAVTVIPCTKADGTIFCC